MALRFVRRYRDDPSAPAVRSFVRDVAVRGLVPALVLIPAVYLAGEHLLPPGGVLGEQAVNQALQGGRTPVLDVIVSSVSHAAGVVGAPLTSIVAFFALRRHTGQWWLAAVPLTAVALEALVYQTTTLLVGRERPEGVEQMDWGLPNSSFPSGHVGASTSLVVVFALLAWSGEHRGRAWLVTLGGAAWVVAVAASRLYLGMHHVSDAVAGVVIGTVCGLIGWNALRRGGRDRAGD